MSLAKRSDMTAVLIRWLLVAIGVAVYEWWFLTNTEAVFMHLPVLGPGFDIFFEIAAPAIVSALLWWIFGRGFAVHPGWVFVSSLMLCALAVCVLAPSVALGSMAVLLRGAARYTDHLPGSHTKPLSRHIAFVVLAPASGVWFAWRNARLLRQKCLSDEL